jgi:hypothetical protein
MASNSLAAFFLPRCSELFGQCRLASGAHYSFRKTSRGPFYRLKRISWAPVASARGVLGPRSPRSCVANRFGPDRRNVPVVYRLASRCALSPCLSASGASRRCISSAGAGVGRSRHCLGMVRARAACVGGVPTARPAKRLVLLPRSTTPGPSSQNQPNLSGAAHVRPYAAKVRYQQLETFPSTGKPNRDGAMPP